MVFLKKKITKTDKSIDFLATKNRLSVPLLCPSVLWLHDSWNLPLENPTIALASTVSYVF